MEKKELLVVLTVVSMPLLAGPTISLIGRYHHLRRTLKHDKERDKVEAYVIYKLLRKCRNMAIINLISLPFPAVMFTLLLSQDNHNIVLVVLLGILLGESIFFLAFMAWFLFFGKDNLVEWHRREDRY